MFSNIEKNMEVGLAAIPPWLKELNVRIVHQSMLRVQCV